MIFLFGSLGQPPPPPQGLIIQYDSIGEFTDSEGNKWWWINPAGEVSPTKSFFIFTKELPTLIAFGMRNANMFTKRLPL